MEKGDANSIYVQLFFEQKMRKLLHEHLNKKCPEKDWSPVSKQIGMFYLSKLTAGQGVALREKHHIYMLPSSGRINIGALTEGTVEKLADAIADVIHSHWQHSISPEKSVD